MELESHPGMRVGVIKDWDSRWFTSKQASGDTLVEDSQDP